MTIILIVMGYIDYSCANAKYSFNYDFKIYINNKHYNSPISKIPITSSHCFENILFHYTYEGDEVVPDGLADDLEKKADIKTMYVPMDQPLG